jgi:hypothetical protein
LFAVDYDGLVLHRLDRWSESRGGRNRVLRLADFLQFYCPNSHSPAWWACPSVEVNSAEVREVEESRRDGLCAHRRALAGSPGCSLEVGLAVDYDGLVLHRLDSPAWWACPSVEVNSAEVREVEESRRDEGRGFALLELGFAAVLALGADCARTDGR